ncbi:helix-turn-helix domain-containing protein [Dokdonia sp. MED134]|uniref:helix-turn-helix domain-containing protein n=1 Tax=Dokdonia sp. MED134 TaxID=313590 RepID=UPI0003208F54|nr:helix-turn-helix transcriptional regulator [Dokdonia sp. MED134]
MRNKFNLKNMTLLGKFLTDKSINKAEVARKTGIRKSRLSNLSTKEDTNLKAEELYLISKAIDANPTEILEKVYGHLRLNN